MSCGIYKETRRKIKSEGDTKHPTYSRGNQGKPVARAGKAEKSHADGLRKNRQTKKGQDGSAEAWRGGQ